MSASGARWREDGHVGGHARYCVWPFHNLMEYCRADPSEPATMEGGASKAFRRDHPAPRIEYGIFHDESADYSADEALEADFYSKADAEARLRDAYAEDGAWVHPIEPPDEAEDEG